MDSSGQNWRDRSLAHLVLGNIVLAMSRIAYGAPKDRAPEQRYMATKDSYNDPNNPALRDQYMRQLVEADAVAIDREAESRYRRPGK